MYNLATFSKVLVNINHAILKKTAKISIIR